MDMSLLREFVVIAVLCTVVIYACHKAKIPPIVGFLITGAVFGPYSLGLVRDIEAVEIMSEVGVVFLLFSIGIELSLGTLIRLKKPVLLGGGIQVAGSVAIITGICLLLNNSLPTSIFIGFLMALSSTAIVLNVFQQKGQADSPAGRISLAMLIFQDLISVPMVLAIPLLAGQQEVDAFHLLLAAGRTLLIIGGVFLLARKLVPWLLRFIVRARNRELFLICVIGICLGTAYATGLMGFSLALGAFMAGLIISESEYSHSAMEGIMPFKDIFTSLFFVSVGMLMNIQYFFAHMGYILLVTVIVLAIKGLVVAGATRILGYPLKIAVITGFAICQVGEFSFVLAKNAMSYALLTDDQYQVFLAASILSMAATPFIMAAAPKFAVKLAAFVRRGEKVEPEKEKKEEGPQDHLIIVGFGSAGQLLARSARTENIPYVILEMNPDTVDAYKAKGEPIHYGDASRATTLETLGVHKARILAIVISDPMAVQAIVQIARHMNKDLYIIARSRYTGEAPNLLKLGASEVIPEEFETAVEVFARVLGLYLVPREEIEKRIAEARSDKYAVQRKVTIPGGSLDGLRRKRPDLGVFALALAPESKLEGKTLMESELRQAAGMTVIAVSRGEGVIYNPAGDFRLLAGDTVYVFGSTGDVDDAAAYFSAEKSS